MEEIKIIGDSMHDNMFLLQQRNPQNHKYYFLPLQTHKK